MQDPALLEKIRQQFDSAPYPNVPLDTNPKDKYDFLFKHSLVTPYYLRHQQVIDTNGKVILDAGCGSGYKSLILAIANPGAKIVGIDLSEQSVDLAQKRLQYHGIDNAEFHAISIEDLPNLGMQFDYINCDEVLYLLPDIDKVLTLFKSVLKPQGIIRGNLHSKHQRKAFFNAQKLFSVMGLMESNPGDAEIDIVFDTLTALKNKVRLKAETYDPKWFERTDKSTLILTNHLLVGDKGYSISELFSLLHDADLEFVSMVNWQEWNLLELFKDTDELPAFWAMCLPELSIEQQLQVFELMHPIHRLLDFWCTHSGSPTPLPLSTWSDTDWENAIVHLHPVLRTEQVKNDLLQAIANFSPFMISLYLPESTKTHIELEIVRAACLLPLWQGPQPIQILVKQYLQMRPYDLITLEPIDPAVALAQVKEFLTILETYLYVLIESKQSP